MKELVHIADGFNELLKELPVSSFAGFLEESGRKIRRIADNTAFHIDLFWKSMFMKANHLRGEWYLVLFLSSG